MISFSLFRIAKRIAGPLPTLELITAWHPYRGHIEKSNLTSDWKKKFLYALGVHDTFLLDIPEKKDVMNMRKVRNLQFKQGNFLKVVRDLMNDVKTEKPDANYSKCENNLNKLSAYELKMSPDLPTEASDWAFNVHSIIAELFNTMEGIQKQAAIPPRINFPDRRPHLTFRELGNSGLDPELKGAFKEALSVKEDFQSYMDSLLRDDKYAALRGLKAAKGAVVAKLHDLVQIIKKHQDDVNEFNEAISVISGYELTTDYMEIDAWTGRVHQLITAMFDKIADTPRKEQELPASHLSANLEFALRHVLIMEREFDKFLKSNPNPTWKESEWMKDGLVARINALIEEMEDSGVETKKQKSFLNQFENDTSDVKTWYINAHKLVAWLVEDAMKHGRLGSIVQRIAAQFPKLERLTNKHHPDKYDIKDSSLTPEQKDAFQHAIFVHDEFMDELVARDALDMSTLNVLRFKQKYLISAVEDLIQRTKKWAPDFNYSKCDDNFKKLSAYEFTLGPKLTYEADKWVAAMHEITAFLFINVGGEVPEEDSSY